MRRPSSFFSSVGGLGLCGLFLLGLFLELGTEQLENGQIRAVADAETGVDDARVAAVAVGKARGDVREQFLVAPGVIRYEAAWRRACSVSRLPSVIICSTSGLAALARVTVVVMRSFSITLVTRLRSVARRCAG